MCHSGCERIVALIEVGVAVFPQRKRAVKGELSRVGSFVFPRLSMPAMKAARLSGRVGLFLVGCRFCRASVRRLWLLLLPCVLGLGRTRRTPETKNSTLSCCEPRRCIAKQGNRSHQSGSDRNRPLSPRARKPHENTAARWRCRSCATESETTPKNSPRNEDYRNPNSSRKDRSRCLLGLLRLGLLGSRRLRKLPPEMPRPAKRTAKAYTDRNSP